MRPSKTERMKTPFLLYTEEVEIRRSVRRTISVEICGNGDVIVRSPRLLPDMMIREFLFRKKDWIDAHCQKKREIGIGNAMEKLTPEELKAIRKKAASDLKARLEKWAPIVGVTYTGVSIRTQHSRWGSCSAKGSISLNALLIELDEELRDYTVVHELCHRKHMNHSKEFWQEVERVLPNYRVLRKRLKEEGQGWIARLP